MTGYDYEYLVADYLKAKGYSRVKVTQSSGDYGIDVLASKGNIRYAVQCKYYSNPVGIKAVQEAVAGMAHYGCNGAMVVTNSTFTEAAQTLAKENGVLLIGNIVGVPKKPSLFRRIKGSIQYRQYLKRAAEIDRTTAEKIAEINKPHILTEAECPIDYEEVARGINATPEEREAIKQLALREKIPSASSIEMVMGMDFVKAKRIADLMNDYGYISNYQWTEKAHK